MKTKYIAGIFLFLTIVLLTGCTQPTSQDTSGTPQDNNQNTQAQAPAQNIPNNQQATIPDSEFGGSAAYLTNFTVTSSGENLQVLFSFLDSDKKDTYAEGVAAIRIADSNNQEVYNSTIAVTKANFQQYTLRLTGKQFTAFESLIPVSQISKTTNGPGGTAYLKFGGTNGTEFEEISAPIFGLPTYTQEEIDALNEEQYKKSTISVNKTENKGNWEITVVSVGFFKQKQTYGGENEYFRIDWKVTNKGSEKDNFYPSGLAVLDNKGNQYEKEYGGTLDSISDIYPGVTKEGYVLIKEIPKDMASAKLMFELGYDEQYDYYSWEFNLPLVESPK